MRKTVHWMQRERLKNLETIKKWIKDIPKDKQIDKDALERKSILILGCTREKAKEYINEILGE